MNSLHLTDVPVTRAGMLMRRRAADVFEAGRPVHWDWKTCVDER